MLNAAWTSTSPTISAGEKLPITVTVVIILVLEWSADEWHATRRFLCEERTLCSSQAGSTTRQTANTKS